MLHSLCVFICGLIKITMSLNPFQFIKKFLQRSEYVIYVRHIYLKFKNNSAVISVRRILKTAINITMS